MRILNPETQTDTPSTLGPGLLQPALSTHGAPRSSKQSKPLSQLSPQSWLASCPGLWFCRRGLVTTFEPGPTPLWGTGRGFATYPQQEATGHLAVTPPCISSITSSSDSPAFCCQELPPHFPPPAEEGFAKSWLPLAPDCLLFLWWSNCSVPRSWTLTMSPADSSEILL